VTHGRRMARPAKGNLGYTLKSCRFGVEKRSPIGSPTEMACGLYDVVLGLLNGAGRRVPSVVMSLCCWILNSFLSPPPLPDVRCLPIFMAGMEYQTATRYRPIAGESGCDCCEEKDGRGKQGFLASKFPDRCTCLLLVMLVASLLTNIALIAQRSRGISEECDNRSTYGIVFVLRRRCLSR
jgi:hypothetical protein